MDEREIQSNDLPQPPDAPVAAGTDASGGSPEHPDAPQPERKRGLKLEISNKDPEYKNAKERLYDRLPFTVKQMDVIIIALVLIAVAVLVVGALKGNGII